MSTELHEFCANLFPATLNGVYQGVILSLLLCLGLRFLGRTNAATRHAIWFLGLVMVVLIIPAHYWLDQRALKESGQPARLMLASQPIDDAAPKPSVVWLDLNTEVPKVLTLPEGDSAREDPVQAAVASDSYVIESSELNGDNGGHRSSVQKPLMSGLRQYLASSSSDLSFPSFLLEPVRWRVESVIAFPLMAALLALWFLVAGFRLALVTLKIHELLKLRDKTLPPEPSLTALFQMLKEQCRARRLVELRISNEQRCPMVIGFFRSIILLPRDVVVQSSLKEIDQILRHELAHVNRFDDWANLVQHLVKAVLFFHPSVWWIHRKLLLEREIACDDHVLQQCGERRDYALTLANVAGRLFQKTPLLAPGVSNSNSQLQQRIHMILNTRRNASPRLAKGRLTIITGAAAGLALLAANSGPRFVLSAAPLAAPNPAISLGSVGVIATSESQVAAVENVDVEVAVSPEGHLIAQAEPAPAVVSVGVDPGPKFKPEAGAEEPTPPPAVIAPAPPEPPDAPGYITAPKPRAPRGARAGRPAKVRAQQDADDGDREGDGSIEERLGRLEKMMRALMEQQGIKRSHAEFAFKDGNQNLNVDQPQIDKMKQAAERQAARAAEQAQRAVEQAKRANKDLEARLEQDRGGMSDFRESFQRQIEALRKAREGLNQEMEKLNRQIEKLEKQQERNDKEQQRRSEALDEKLQAQGSFEPAPTK